jgi:hypothetical protein
MHGIVKTTTSTTIVTESVYDEVESTVHISYDGVEIVDNGQHILIHTLDKYDVTSTCEQTVLLFTVLQSEVNVQLTKLLTFE